VSSCISSITCGHMCRPILHPPTGVVPAQHRPALQDTYQQYYTRTPGGSPPRSFVPVFCRGQLRALIEAATAVCIVYKAGTPNSPAVVVLYCVCASPLLQWPSWCGLLQCLLLCEGCPGRTGVRLIVVVCLCMLVVVGDGACAGSDPGFSRVLFGCGDCT
jgi:hypothetical protein